MKIGFLSYELLVDWQRLTPDRVESDIEAALEEAKAEIEAICQVDASQADFDNTFLALERAGETLSRAWGRVEHLTSVNDSKSLREAYNQMLPKVTEFNTGIPLNPRLWQALKYFAGKAAVADLQGIEKRLFEETVADFEQAGANLDEISKRRLEDQQRAGSENPKIFGERIGCHECFRTDYRR